MRKLQGGIDTTTNGRFRVRIRKKTVGVFDTWDEAEAIRLASLEALVDEQGPSGETLAQLGQHVLTVRELRKKVRDPESDWSRWRLHVQPDAIARLSLRSMRTDHLESWLERLEEKGIAAQTRRNCLNVVRVVLRAAVKKRLLRSNPALGIRIESDGPSDWTYLVPAEQAATIAATPEPERPIIEIAIGSGIRAGEMVSLHLEDVHVDVAEPHMVIRFGKKGKLPPKSAAGLRVVPLFGIALDAARRWLAALPSYAPKNPLGLMFPTRRGCMRDDRHVLPWPVWKGRPATKTRAAQPGILERAGITRPFRWHDLRHTCASSLASGWWGRRWSLEEIRGFLGHSTIAVTQRYAHLAPSAVTQAARETGHGVAKVSFGTHPRGIATVRGGFEDRGPRQLATRLRDELSRVLPPGCKDGGVAGFDRRDTALALLRAVAEGHGDDAQQLAEALAAATLASAEIGLALSILDGGPLAVTHAIALATSLLDAAPDTFTAGSAGAAEET